MHDLFEDIKELPNSDAMTRYENLVGLDDVKEKLVKETELLLVPSLLDKWSQKHYKTQSGIIDYVKNRPPLFIFAGDVGTGKTALAESFADPVARRLKIDIKLYSMSLNARGTGAVGEMTRLISTAFDTIKQEAKSVVVRNGKPSAGFILLIDEADALAQSREFAQMHHEDRAGVNALIRGIDNIANEHLPVICIMCTNRLNAIDPAVYRRAGDVFYFSRPNHDQRLYMLERSFKPLDISNKELIKMVDLTGESEKRQYGFTYSDFTQRLFPNVVLDAFPSMPINVENIVQIIERIEPTPPFQELLSG